MAYTAPNVDTMLTFVYMMYILNISGLYGGTLMKVDAKIQKWGNGLALRVSGAIRDVPKLMEGMLVEVEIHEDGFTVKKQTSKKLSSFTEEELFSNLTPESAHADMLAEPTKSELDY